MGTANAWPHPHPALHAGSAATVPRWLDLAS